MNVMATHEGMIGSDEGPTGAGFWAKCKCGWTSRSSGAKDKAEAVLAEHLDQGKAQPMTSTSVEPVQPPRGITVRETIEKQGDQLARALPKHLSPDRFLRLVLTEIRTVEHLADCSTSSLLGAVMKSAQLGLEPGGTLGLCWYLPFKNKNGDYEAQFILGYKGYIALALRSGQVRSLVAREVRDTDKFSYAYGLEEHLTHVPQSGKGAPYMWYAVAKFVNGGHTFVVLDRENVEDHRKRSKSPNSPAWRDDYSAMARKTCIRVLAPYLPLTTEAATAIDHDEDVYDISVDTMDPTPAIRPGYVDDDGVVSVPVDEPPETNPDPF